MTELAVMMQTPEFTALPVDERASVVAWDDAMRNIDGAANKLAACRQWAERNGHRRGWSLVNIRRKYYGWVAAGRSWSWLVDLAVVPPQMDLTARRGVAEAFLRYCEENQRASKPAWRAMLRDLRRGKHIPGVGTWQDLWLAETPDQTPPDKCPFGWTPKGWQYSNMLRKFKSSKFELVAMRKGAVAARQYAPAVYSTRVGLTPGRIYQFDDVWHDIKVALPGVNRALMRPLEFGCVDVASTNKIAWGMRSQIQREDGSREGLSKAQFKALIAYVLCNVGWHREGTIFVIEHGTTSLSQEDQELVTRLTGGAVTFRTSNILGEQVLSGMHPGQSHGNFRAKALIEGSHRLIHYEAAALPGQTGGLARVDDPEHLYGLEAYAAKVLAATERVPEDQRQALWYGGALTFTAYRRLVDDLYGIIHGRTEHNIEGWEQNEWMLQEWSIDGRGDWRAVADIPTLPVAVQDLARAALDTPGLSRMRRMSPVEVWRRYEPELVRLPHWAVCTFLGDDCFRKVRVGHDGIISFQDRDLTGTASKLRYAGAVLKPEGTQLKLCPGVEYGLYVLPHDMSKAVVVDADDRAVIGIAPMWHAVSPLSADQVKTMQEAQARMIAAQTAPLIERHAERNEDLLARREQNDALLSKKSPTARPPRKAAIENHGMTALRALATARTDYTRKEGTTDGW